MSTKSLFALIVLGFAAMLASSSLFIVKETEEAVMLEFGRVVKTDIKPGMHFKLPIYNEVRKFDGRILTVDASPERYLTLEKKAVIVDSYAKWRVIDVAKYYTATSGEELRAHALLSQRINAGLRNQVAERSMHEVVSGQRDELMTELTDSLSKIALTEFGIEIVDVRVKRIDLPREVEDSVFRRMNTEREREAREHRSQGKELAEGIKAGADREVVVIKSSAYRDAERIRGEGDAAAAKIYADAYGKDPEFYSFWRSLLAYKTSFNGGQDLMIIEPDGEFFKYLKSAQGK